VWQVLELYDLYMLRANTATHPQHARLWGKLFDAHPQALRTFAHVLRLRYPRATRADIAAMCAMTAPREELKARAEWEKTMHTVERLFGCLDANGDGGVELTEFLAACEGVPGLPKDSELRALFRAKDVDGNGILDFGEFKTLVESADMQRVLTAVCERRKEQLSGKWMVSRRTMLGREAHLSG